MKIKWRVSIALVFLCIAMILLESSITMMQLKDNMERESNAVISKTSVQTVLSFSYISDDIEHYLFNMCRSAGVANMLSMPESENSRAFQLKAFLRSITDSTDYIASAYIIEEDNGKLYGYSGSDVQITMEEVTAGLDEGFFDTEKDIQWFCDTDGRIFIRRAIYNLYPYRKVGAVIVNVSQESLFSMLGIDQSSGGFFCIFNSDHDLILNGSADPQAVNLIISAYREAAKKPDCVVSISYNGETYDVYLHPKADQGWNVLYLVAKHEKLASYYAMNSSLWTIGLILCIVGVCIAFVISWSLTKRITDMMHQVQQIGGGQPKKRVEITGRDEIAELAEKFNSMLDKIEAMYQKITDQRMKEEKMRYDLLDIQFRSIQARVAPHFICNLLGALNSYAVIGETDKVEQLVVHASRYFRKNIVNSDKRLSTVAEEFATIDEYIMLYQSVFGQPHEYKKAFLNEEAKTLLMPSLLLQPLIENSLKYYRDESGVDETSITLSADFADNRLQLILEDSSGNLPQGVLEAIHNIATEGVDGSHRLGFGLSGIIRRLKIMFDSQFDFQVSPLEEHRKRIVISIPAITMENCEK